MRFALLSLALALPAGAETVLSTASGNWAGPSNDGFYFAAQLVQNRDKARLLIWNGFDPATVSQGDPQFDNAEIALSAFVTRQELEVYDNADGTTLQVVTEFADEAAEGRDVVQIRFIDFQYTVTGYYHRSTFYNPGGEPFTYECDISFDDLTVIENGQERRIPDMPHEEMNASYWTWDAAFQRGFCTRTE
jgi:hypothetical protein